MAYFLGLLFALVAFWIGMSGHFEPLLLGLGAVSLGLTMILAYRLDILDREGVPYVRLVGFAMYFPWLMKEIIKANWTVIRACLRAELDIAPTLVKLKTTCTSDLAKVTFANSITLTPGTVTIEIDGDKLLVHGLYEQDSQPEAFIEMDRRSARAIDGKGAAA
ncbi:MAG: Na+/H+ antiporter subunit E [Alphaproteobacteria bacterium]|uniref:Na+/H+ antiporter subunit E n=1 Tax=Hyphomonas sp. TaxID=87 RepID=UPI001DE5FDE6|nr:Na+/H+ antiporter subunit E [Alphaproteobacteria bacterium]MBU2083785.1 Na+/H+ antiporter subunit E [Alphaproteobacteria bacterium]MBU2141723.1 Na+/H+ antiporter subunit E [Alphaproteobacteria bacterium]MBU2197077.1 Na+/H+ antiporter subunit E [Alphaproteobacteria bacterium]